MSLAPEWGPIDGSTTNIPAYEAESIHDQLEESSSVRYLLNSSEFAQSDAISQA